MRAKTEDRELLRQFQEVERLPGEDKQIVKTLLEALLLRRKIQSLATQQQQVRSLTWRPGAGALPARPRGRPACPGRPLAVAPSPQPAGWTPSP